MTRNPVLVYNLGGYELIHPTSEKRARRLVEAGKASEHEVEIVGSRLVLVSIMLARYVETAALYRRDNTVARVPWWAIKARDGHRCGYCLVNRGTTVDHILPKSRGGAETWENLVAACERCNQAKADRTPEEAGMKLLLPVYEPKDEHRFRVAHALNR